MGRPSKCNNGLLEKILGLLESGYGVRGACAAAGISTSTYYQWLKDRREFAERTDIACNRSLGKAEMKLNDYVEQGDIRAIRYFLKSRDAAGEGRSVKMNIATSLKQQERLERDIEALYLAAALAQFEPDDRKKLEYYLYKGDPSVLTPDGNGRKPLITAKKIERLGLAMSLSRSMISYLISLADLDRIYKPLAEGSKRPA